MALIRPRVCAGWSEPLLVAYTTLLEDHFTMLLVHVRTNIFNRLITTAITTLIALVGIKSGTAAQGPGPNIGSKIGSILQCMHQAEFKYCPFPY